MNNRFKKDGICITFARVDDPNVPIKLDKITRRKFGHVPSVMKPLAKFFGSLLAEPTLLGGDVRMDASDENDLFILRKQALTELNECAQGLIANSQKQPPLHLKNAVRNPSCIELLRALAKVFAECSLTVSLDIEGDSLELPHVPLSAFTEPAEKEVPKAFFKQVIGSCCPTHEANQVVLKNRSLLLLPKDDYFYEPSGLLALILQSDLHFSGAVVKIKTGLYQALPGGKLVPKREPDPALAL